MADQYAMSQVHNIRDGPVGLYAASVNLGLMVVQLSLCPHPQQRHLHQPKQHEYTLAQP